MQESRIAVELVLPRIARGEADAVRECLERYGPLVWSLAKRLTRDAAALEDVVQEIFIDVWRTAPRFDPDKASEPTFIAVIARRRVIDRYRREGRGPALEPLEETSAAGEEEGFERVDLSDEARVARGAIDRLRPEQRRVILMSVVEGRTHEEIAALTGMPLGTVKSHIRRGLERASETLRSERGGAP